MTAQQDPDGASRLHLGVLALVAAAAGLASGLFLAFHYAPTLAEARASVAHLQTSVLLGGFLRGVHHWAGHIAVALAALHGLRVLWQRKHRGTDGDAAEVARPRRRRWVLGGLLFLVLVGFAYTGYLLPADARARTGLDVMHGVARSTPLAGDAAAAVLAGGAEVSSATLVRLYAVHTLVLPVALFAVLLALAGGRAGLRPRLSRANALGGIAVLGSLALLSMLAPAPVGPEYDPEIGAEGQPEWFFLWVNELLHRFGSRTFLVGAVVPGALVVLGLALPWLRLSRRAERTLAGFVLAGLTLLTAAALARNSGDDPAAPEPRADEAQPDGTAGELDAQVAPILKRFRCAKCHFLDDDEDGDGSGPPLYRKGNDKLPPFPELYTREFFRRKVGDPEALWPDTGMTYPRRAGLPTEQQLDLLERWFFDAK